MDSGKILTTTKVATIIAAWLAGFLSRLFAVIRFESIIHEFDPWFNYRATHYMVEHGWIDFLNWFDERAWYPLGRIVGGTTFPGLMVVSGTIHYVLQSLNINVDIRDICVFLAPTFSGLTSLATYLLTKELWSEGAGLFAAGFMAIVPGYTSRSVAGSYDNEGIAIFAMIFTYYLWIKAVKTGSIMWATHTALAYFFMVSAWGGYVFIINLIPLHVFVLILMGRYSDRLYVAYSTFYPLALLLSMQIPFVGFQPVRTSEHMASAGIFVLVQAVEFLKHLKTVIPKAQSKMYLLGGSAIVSGLVFLTVIVLTQLGYIAPWSGRFYSLWDTGYAKIHIPIIASVSEHQPTTWFAFFFDLHFLVAIFPIGLWQCISHVNDERVFIALYAVTASYFAGVMVRLMLTLAPVVCVLSGIPFSEMFTHLLKDDDVPTAPITAGPTQTEKPTSQQSKNTPQPSKQTAQPAKMKKIRQERDKKELGISKTEKYWMAFFIGLGLAMFVAHCTWVTSNAYSSPSIVLASYNNDGSRVILDDFREAYSWLSHNTPDKARVMAWWDYGYQIAGMANRTTIVDNNTWNNSHIALVGLAMASEEDKAYEIMQSLDIDYVLVVFGGVIGYSGDDINKFLWMVRIGEGEHPDKIRESDFFTERGEFRVDSGGTKTLLNCLMYKLSYYGFGELMTDPRAPAGFDRTRNVEIGNKNIKLEHLEEAYTTEHWLVRIYKVLPPPNRPSFKKKRA